MIYSQIVRVCLNVGETVSPIPDAPSDLVTSEVTARSFRVTWAHAPGTVEKYRVVYYASRGGKPEEVCVCVCEDTWT